MGHFYTDAFGRFQHTSDPQVGDGGDALYEAVTARIDRIGFSKLRELFVDYRDEVKLMAKAGYTMPDTYREWLRDKVTGEVIAESYERNRRWY